jgi:hypothetical protein
MNLEQRWRLAFLQAFGITRYAWGAIDG